MIEDRRCDPGGLVVVTFRLAPEVTGETASVVGEFNDWSTTENAMTRNGDGCFVTTVALPPGRAYRFRYLLDGRRWENDWHADAYVPNEFGGDDSVVDLTAFAPCHGNGGRSSVTTGDQPARR